MPIRPARLPVLLALVAVPRAQPAACAQFSPGGRLPALRGMEEAERQLRVAQRLYAASGAAKPWAKLQVQDRRRWIDRSCDAEHRDEVE